MANIGKLEKVDLRDFWKHEERDFPMSITWQTQQPIMPQFLRA